MNISITLSHLAYTEKFTLEVWVRDFIAILDEDLLVFGDKIVRKFSLSSQVSAIVVSTDGSGDIKVE